VKSKKPAVKGKTSKSSGSSSGKNITMADLLAKSKSQIKSYSRGEKVEGTVIAKGNKSLILDIGGKSEGLVAERAFSEARDFIKGLKVGEKVTTTVLVGETRDGYTLLSLRHAASDAHWEKLQNAKDKKEAVVVSGKAVNQAGVTVDVEGMGGFIPSSQLGKQTAKKAQELVGKYFKAKVIELDRNSNKVVLSEKEVSESADIKKTKEALVNINVGDVYDAQVTTIANFGCFAKLVLPKEDKDIEIEGLVHISELSWGKVEKTSDVVSVGDKIKVKVIAKKDDRLSLSVKQALEDPWEGIAKKYPVETKFTGKITKISDFGAFVEIEPGVEGLIHITKIPPAQKLNEGQEVNCYVDEIDPKSKKISLGLVLSQKPIGYK